MHPDISCTLLLAARSLMSPRLPARNHLLLLLRLVLPSCLHFALATPDYTRLASKYTRHHVPHPDPRPITIARRQTTVRILHDYLHVHHLPPPITHTRRMRNSCGRPLVLFAC